VEPAFPLTVSQDRLRDVIEHVRLLAADADTQNAWLHPCGWTRHEPYEHTEDHPPCGALDELMQSYTDMWPAWRSVLAPVLTTDGQRALDRLGTCLEGLDAAAYVDEISTLDGEAWVGVRRVASETLAVLART
jgi:hypothetical protein